jgi:hypothetical protein
MRRTLTVCRHGFPLAAAVVLLTACGGSGNDDASSSSSAPTSGAAETGAADADSEFCTQAAGIEQTVGATLNDQSDPTSIPQALQTAATQIRAIDPPQEIAGDWKALADGVDQIAAAVAGVDFSDPNAVATFEKQVGQLESQLSGASTNVENYLSEHCGLGGSGSAAPSS